MKCIYFENIHHKYPTLLFHCQPIRHVVRVQMGVALAGAGRTDSGSQQVCFCLVLWR